jgi:hypothetical protein
MGAGLVLAALALAGGEAGAANICGAGGIATSTWDGGASTSSWHDAANWSGDTLPQATDHVCIPDTAIAAVGYSSGTTSVLSLESQEALSVTGGSLSFTDSGQDSTITALTLASNVGVTLGGASNLTVGDFDWNGGTISASSPTTTTTVTGSLDVSSGGISNRTLSIASGVTGHFSGSGVFSVLDLSTGAVLDIDAGGTLELTGDGDIGNPGDTTTLVRNDGTIRKNGGTGTSRLLLPVQDNAAVQVQSGRLQFNRSVSTDVDGGTYTLSGGTTLDFVGGTNALGPSTITDGAASATVRFGDGNNTTLTAANALTVENVLLQSGPTVTLSGANTIPHLTLNLPSGGTLGGAGNLSVGDFDWDGGTIAASSPTTTTTVTGDLDVSSGGISNRTLNIPSGVTASYTGNGGTFTTLGLDTGAVLDIDAGGTFELTGDADLGSSDATTLVRNDGMLAKTGGGGTSRFLVPLTNNGELETQTGTVQTNSSLSNAGTLDVKAGTTVDSAGSFSNFSGGTLTGGTYLVAGAFRFGSANVLTNAATVDLDGAAAAMTDRAGTPLNGLRNLATNAAAGSLTIRGGKNLTTATASALSNAGSLNVQNASTLTVGSSGTSNLTNTGTLKGTGTVAGNVINSTGVVTPGLSPGILAVSGNYTQQAGGTLRTEIAGTTVGSGYDRLVVGGAASLNGTLDIVTDNSFSPTVGSTFQVESGTRTGTFSTIQGQLLPSGNEYKPLYNAADVTLEVIARPAPPVLTDTDPDSPSNQNNIQLKGSVEDNTEIRVYRTANCSGPIDSTWTAAELESTGPPGMQFFVFDNTTNHFSATAKRPTSDPSDCSNSITYVEDSTAPTVGLTATDPPSPSNANNPRVKGTTSGNPVSVTIYGDHNCSGPALATGTPAQLASPGIQVTVPSDSTTELRVSAVDAAGNTEDCGGGIVYVEDSTAPGTPVLNGTSPSSPANENRPSVEGTAEATARVNVYTTADCSGLPAGEGLASDSGLQSSLFHVPVDVPADQTTELRATATDAAGNISGCSAPISYTEDSTPPSVSITGGPNGLTNVTSGTFTFTHDGVSVECSLDGGIPAFRACSGPGSDNYDVGGDLSLTFRVRSTDAVGNQAEATRSFSVVPLRCEGQVATIVGSGPTINGTDGADVIVADSANNIIDGKGGADRICAGGGKDSISGRGGPDRIFGEAGQDLIEGGSGDDFVHGGTGADKATFSGAGQAVTANLGAGTATGDGTDSVQSVEGLSGSPFDDTLKGDGGENDIGGGGGKDTLDGRGGDDDLAGSGGADLMSGGTGLDQLFGGFGDDTLHGQPGSDELHGEGGSDALFGEDGADFLDGGSGLGDDCDGGKGEPDKANGSCEEIRGVP